MGLGSRRVLCPQCARHYRRSQIQDVDETGQRWTTPDEGYRGAIREVAAVLTRDKRWLADQERRHGLARDRAGVVARCPAGHPLPSGYARRRAIVIGLIGPAGSSKSTFLGMLVHRLVHHADLRHLGLTFSLEDPRSRELFNWRYHAPLEQGRPPAPTAAHHPADSLVVRMQGHGRDVNLFFYDAGGEALGRARDNAHLNPFLTVMDAALIFWTPAALALPPSLQATGAEPGVVPGPHRVIQVINTIAANLAVDATRRDIPTAAILAKSDQITGLLTDGQGGALGELVIDQRLLADPQSVIDAQGEIPYRVTDTFAPGIIQAVEEFSGRRSFHAISATGRALTGDPRPPSPVRILEPLIAVLDGLDVLRPGTR